MVANDLVLVEQDLHNCAGQFREHPAQDAIRHRIRVLELLHCSLDVGGSQRHEPGRRQRIEGRILCNQSIVQIRDNFD